MGDSARGSTLAPRVTYQSPVLRAKLRPPSTPAHLVDRVRLYDRLDELVARQLTTVVAPAGFGKSVLLASWAARFDGRLSWLSLDESDGDGWQFWADAIEAIAAFPGVACDGAREALRQSAGLTHVAVELLNDIDRTPEPPRRCVLVLDDLHVVDSDEDLSRSIGVFLQHLPSWLHVVVSSRRELNLPTDRLRGQGRLSGVELAELRFLADEASEMLARLVPSLSATAREDTAARMDGWAAGLQLAALRSPSILGDTIGAAVDVSMADAERLVDDFIRNEVLVTERAELVATLLDVSVVDRVNASLAASLTESPEAGELLEEAVRRGLFVSRRAAGWFEIHSLVRSAFRSQLERQSPDRFKASHARAAAWFEAIGDIPLALAHLLAADRHRDALRLLTANNAVLYDSGREATIINTISAIPHSTRVADTQAMLEYTWCQLLVDRRAFVEAVAEAADWIEHRSDEPVLRPRITVLQSLGRLLECDWSDAGVLARRAIDEFGDGWSRDQLGRFAPNQVAREIAYSERWREELQDVQDTQLALVRDPPRRAALEATRAVGHALAGEPVEALRIAAGVKRTAQISNMTPMRVELALAEAIAHRELGDRVRAVPELQNLADTPAETMLICRMIAICELAEAHLDAHHHDAARAELDRGQTLASEQGLRKPIRERLARVAAAVALAEGAIQEAREWATTIGDPFWGPATLARVCIASGESDEALAHLRQAVPRCPRHEVKLALLRSRATRHQAESIQFAADALQTAAALGQLQSVASEGSEIADVIERVSWVGSTAWMDRLRHLMAASAGLPAAGDANQIEQLTAREREILRYLPSRLTVREIANECYVSVNTLKFHLKVIYRKLGVGSRAEAAARARQLMAR